MPSTYQPAEVNNWPMPLRLRAMKAVIAANGGMFKNKDAYEAAMEAWRKANV